MEPIHDAAHQSLGHVIRFRLVSRGRHLFERSFLRVYAYASNDTVDCDYHSPVRISICIFCEDRFREPSDSWTRSSRNNLRMYLERLTHVPSVRFQFLLLNTHVDDVATCRRTSYYCTTTATTTATTTTTTADSRHDL